MVVVHLQLKIYAVRGAPFRALHGAAVRYMGDCSCGVAAAEDAAHASAAAIAGAWNLPGLRVSVCACERMRVGPGG